MSDSPIQSDRDGTSDSMDLEGAFGRWQGELLGTLYHLLGNAHDARDVLQETFLKCWRTRDRMEGVINLKAWVFRVALNTGRDYRSSAWRRRRRNLEDVGDSLLDAKEVCPLEKNEELERIRSAIHHLRGEDKEVFLLRQNGEVTYEEIAEILNLPVGTVKTRMRRALQALQAAVAPRPTTEVPTAERGG